MKIQHPRARTAIGLTLTFLIFAACGILSPAVNETPEATLAPVVEATGPTDPGDPADPTQSSEPTEPADPTDSEPTDPTNAQPSGNLNAVFAPFWEARDLLHQYFVNQPIDDAILAQGAIDGILAFNELADAEITDQQVQAFSDAADTPAEVEAAFADFWETWIAAGHPDDVELMQQALRGMVDSLGDEHTSYLDPDELFQASTPIEGSYEGIGAWVDPDGDYLTIITPMPNSPAEGAGLLPGDQIIAVDGDDMTGIDGNQVIRRVVGPAGTDVTLTVRREGIEDFDVTITRAQIVVPSINGEILEGTDIAYVQLFSFGETTGDQLREILQDLLAQNPSGLILDLRNNGGGLLSTAIEIASEFIEDGVLMYEEFGDGSSEVYDAFGEGLATEIPMVVLINSGSASASEIVAGAIQDYGRAPLVGTTSFGKGSVQFWLPLSDDGAVRVTIALWYTPEERQIHGSGLEPDVVVELTEEDATAELDPQLDAAIEILTTGGG
ncbi:MAG TPA: S41 family peptidase [Anaerolineales bacterium]|nr:S41 family peptidase [Anaerolineales bacterium]